MIRSIGQSASYSLRGPNQPQIFNPLKNPFAAPEIIEQQSTVPEPDNKPGFLTRYANTLKAFYSVALQGPRPVQNTVAAASGSKPIPSPKEIVGKVKSFGNTLIFSVVVTLITAYIIKVFIDKRIS